MALTKKQVNDIAKIFIASPLLLGDSFDAENLSDEDNNKVQNAIKEIAIKLLGQTKVGETATSDFDVVEKVLNYNKNMQ